MERLEFASKVDLWIGLLIAGSAVVSLAVSGYVLTTQSSVRWMVALTLFSVGVALPMSILFRTGYTVTDELLIVRSGPFSWNVRISEIKSVRRVRDMASSPALSLDRVLVSYGPGKELMVSPRDEDRFVTEISKRARGM